MSDYITSLFGTQGYLACFVVLLLCGLGLPLPEEVTLLGAGMLVATGDFEFWRAVLVCGVAILVGDSIPFLLGRRYGLRALRISWIAKILHPERFAKLRKRFDDHGDWATFSLRFVTGLRIPGYFVAGTLGMSTWRFLLLDGLGVLVSVPLLIWLGELFSQSIENLHRRVHRLHLVLGFLVMAVFLTLLVRYLSRRNPS